MYYKTHHFVQAFVHTCVWVPFSICMTYCLQIFIKTKSHNRWAIKNHMTQIWKHLNIVLFYLFENINHHKPLSNLVNVMRIYTFTTFLILERRSSSSHSHSSFAASCSSSSSLLSQTQQWKIVWIRLSTLFLHKNLSFEIRLGAAKRQETITRALGMNFITTATKMQVTTSNIFLVHTAGSRFPPEELLCFA